jgi:hypothetical protein
MARCNYAPRETNVLVPSIQWVKLRLVHLLQQGDAVEIIIITNIKEADEDDAVILLQLKGSGCSSDLYHYYCEE